jgi:hypothetical protein
MEPTSRSRTQNHGREPDSEAVAVLGRIYANCTQERSPHDLGTAKAALGGDSVDANRRLLESPAGGFDLRALDESSRSHPDLTGEHASEVTHAHRGSPRERRHRKIGTRMLANPHYSSRSAA